MGLRAGAGCKALSEPEGAVSFFRVAWKDGGGVNGGREAGRFFAVSACFISTLVACAGIRTELFSRTATQTNSAAARAPAGATQRQSVGLRVWRMRTLEFAAGVACGAGVAAETGIL